MAFLSEGKLRKLKLKKLGRNVKISDKAVFYGIDKIEIGDNTRIDDFSIISAGEGGIIIGKNVHIACYVSLIGKAKIFIDNFAGISSRSAVYSSNDDYSGNFLTGPTVPEEFTNVRHADVIIGKHVVIGAFSMILPGVSIGDGSAVAAFSLVNSNVENNIIVGGIPSIKLKPRNKGLFNLERKFKNE